MELQDLVGHRKLSGLDVSSISTKSYLGGWWKYYEEVTRVRFVLDSVAYAVVENPDDGYRSNASEPRETNEYCLNVFGPVDVVCEHRKVHATHRGEDDVLLIKNATTGETILEIGTSNIDDYYPSFVCNFSAEAIGRAE